MMACCLAIGVVRAQTKIYIDNQTDLDIGVSGWSTSGDKVSKKAWRKGKELIAPGEREWVLSLNRSGKLNWMDPTPRYVEPDKTVVFHTQISLGDMVSEKAVTLLQKLYGEGTTTKMWYAIDGVDGVIEWVLENKENHRQLIAPVSAIVVVYKAYDDGKNTHVEYIFSNP